MSYEKYYPGGWQSGESGGTPITPEALNHIENGIKQTYSDFAPAQEDASFPGCYYRMVNGIKEWINPPMIPGVEYRTAERWNGGVVYAKCVDCGELVPGSATAVYPNIGMPIRWSGRTEGGTALPFVPYVNDRSTDITIGVQPGTIFISAGSARAAEKVYVSVRYVQ